LPILFDFNLPSVLWSIRVKKGSMLNMPPAWVALRLMPLMPDTVVFNLLVGAYSFVFVLLSVCVPAC